MTTQDSIKFNCQVMKEEGDTVKHIHTTVDKVKYVITIQELK